MTCEHQRPLLLPLALTLPLWLSACTATEGDDDEIGESNSGEVEGDGDGDPGGETGGDEWGDGDAAGEGGDDGGPAPGDGDGDGDPIDPGQLTAGEWRDLDHWDFWIGLGAQGSDWLEHFDAWGLDTRERIPVLALAGAAPVVDAPIVLRDAEDQIIWSARTDNQGRAELWPALRGEQPSWPLTVASGNFSVELDELPDGFDPILLELPAKAPVDLDLMFVVDTTGSMSDELEYLKVELDSVITRAVAELGGEFELRISVNFYRDHGDEYVVRSFPFTTEVDTALTQLATQLADGGGDYPEAVSEALADGVDGHDWSAEARARLLFFVLDAPPHDNPTNRAALADSVASAAAKGIRVIPLGASGIDKDTEFLLRNIDIATGATYTFLTDHSGIGEPHLEPTVGDYDVELLDDLMVRLIVEAMQ